MRRFIVLLLAVVSCSMVAACQPATPSAPPALVFSHDDGWAAVDQAFADWGPEVVAAFHCIASRESGHWPYSQNGRYKGLLQIDSLNGGYQGSMQAAADTLGRGADWFDPYVNARTGRIIFDYRMSRGLDPFTPWSTSGGCR